MKRDGSNPQKHHRRTRERFPSRARGKLKALSLEGPQKLFDPSDTCRHGVHSRTHCEPCDGQTPNAVSTQFAEFLADPPPEPADQPPADHTEFHENCSLGVLMGSSRAKIVRFATICVCGKRSEEYTSWPTCTECQEYTCLDCAEPETNTEDERNEVLCKRCKPTAHPKIDGEDLSDAEIGYIRQWRKGSIG